MAVTFGAATTDQLTHNAVSSSFAPNNGAGLITCWFYPTTLTATRTLWGFGTTSLITNNRLAIDTTTTQLRFTSSHSSQGQWTLASAISQPIVTGQWQFVAVLFTWASATTAIRAWQATAEQPPTEMTVTQTAAPTGTITTGALTCGNAYNGATLAFQGDIGPMTWVSAGSLGVTSPFGIVTTGAINQTEADLNRDRWVRPIWDGIADAQALRSPAGTFYVTNTSHDSADLGFTRMLFGVTPQTVRLSLLGTETGTATLTQNNPPRPTSATWQTVYRRTRR